MGLFDEFKRLAHPYEDEDEEFEKRKKEALQRIRAREEIGDRTRRF